MEAARALLPPPTWVTGATTATEPFTQLLRVNRRLHPLQRRPIIPIPAMVKVPMSFGQVDSARG